jgi:predicted AAA+ superfamily ATPase
MVADPLFSWFGEGVSYIPRVVDAEIADRLTSSGAVVVEGPKACGKTETARRHTVSSVLLDVDPDARAAAEIDPGLVLDGDTPRLIDEWQEAPGIWNHVRRAVDDRGRPGQFILTGSSTPDDDISRHTGAGRFSFVRMRPMSLYETTHANGSVSLRRILDGDVPNVADTRFDIIELVNRLCIGGWPLNQQMSLEQALRANRDYLRQMREVDVSRVAGARRDPVKIGALLTSLARNTATEVAVKVLAADAGGSDDQPLDWATTSNYLDALNRLNVIEDQPAWAPHLRSKATLRSAAKRHLVDPSLAVAALGAGAERIRRDRNLLGLLFESMVVRDLRVYAQACEGQVFHYRDSYGIEVDAIIQVPDGRWIACEVKLAPGSVDAGARSLLHFKDAVDLDKVGEPAALIVVTGSGYGYRRPDGVGVVPIGALGP